MHSHIPTAGALPSSRGDSWLVSAMGAKKPKDLLTYIK